MTGILTHLCFPSFWRIFPTLSAWLSPFYELSLMAPGVTGASICGCQVNEWGRADIRGKSDIDDWPQYFEESRRSWRQADWRTCAKEGHSLLTFSKLLPSWNMGPSLPNILTIPEKPGISILWEISQFYVFRVSIFQNIVGPNQKQVIEWTTSFPSLLWSCPSWGNHSIRLNHRKLLRGSFIGFNLILWSSQQYSM